MPDYRVIRSDRRTLSLELTRGGEWLVRAPKRTSAAHIREFVASRQDWMEKQAARLRARQAALGAQAPLTDGELASLREAAKRVFPERAAYFAPRLQVHFGRVTIRCQRTRWGSCSSKGNLNFNCLLLLAPPEVLDYVVVHELCHLREMNHSARFWAEVARVLPDWQARRAWLKENGQALLSRAPAEN